MTRRPCTFKQGDISRALRAVRAAGLEVDRVEIDPDGKIVLVSGNASDQRQDDLDRELSEWEAANES